MNEVWQFLKECGTYYLATVDGDEPRVRPFGTAEIFEDKLYIQTGKKKACYRELIANPNAEICCFKDGKWLRRNTKKVFLIHTSFPYEQHGTSNFQQYAHQV